MGFLIPSLIGTVLGTVIVAEAKSWMPYLSRWLVRSVVDRFPEELPEDQRARWSEEIEGDLESLADRPLGALWFAVGVRRAGAKGLAAELMLQQALATGVGASGGRGARDGDPGSLENQRRERILREYESSLEAQFAEAVMEISLKEFVNNRPAAYLREVSPGRLEVSGQLEFEEFGDD